MFINGIFAHTLPTLARLQQERSDLLYNSLRDEYHKLRAQVQSRNNNTSTAAAYELSCYYKELVRQIEYEKEKLHHDNLNHQMALKELEKKYNANLVKLKEAVKNINREKNLQLEEHKKQLLKKDEQIRQSEAVHGKLEMENVKLVAEVRDRGQGSWKRGEGSREGRGGWRVEGTYRKIDMRVRGTGGRTGREESVRVRGTGGRTGREESARVRGTGGRTGREESIRVRGTGGRTGREESMRVRGTGGRTGREESMTEGAT